MEYKLDTSGHVEIDRSNGKARVVTWSNLSPFAQGYTEALFAAAFGHWADCIPAFSDLAPETLAQIIADCDRAKTWSWGLVSGEVAGRSFWARRQAGDYANADSAGYFPPLTVQLADDGKVRFAA